MKIKSKSSKLLSVPKMRVPKLRSYEIKSRRTPSVKSYTTRVRTRFGKLR